MRTLGTRVGPATLAGKVVSKVKKKVTTPARPAPTSAKTVASRLMKAATPGRGMRVR